MTSLVTERDTREVLTATRETDAARALVRGLAEYLGGLSVAWRGTEYKLMASLPEWANREQSAKYPTAVVMEDESGAVYSTAPMSPPSDGLPLEGDPEWEARVGRFVKVPLHVEVWCTNPVERMALGAMLEDAADPVDWMGGFRLVLPHYHGVHATFDLVSAQSRDNADDTQRRYSVLLVDYMAECPVVRLRRVPPAMRLRSDLRTVDAAGVETRR